MRRFSLLFVLCRGKMVKQLILFLCFAFVAEQSAQLFCSDVLKRNQTKYYPLRHCQRSNKTVIGMKNVANLQKCVQFADSNRALAFNYGHGKKPQKKTIDNNLINLFDLAKMKNQTKNNTTSQPTLDVEFEQYYNCEILSCPEFGNMSSMINDTRYDYYSAYANPIRKNKKTEDLLKID